MRALRNIGEVALVVVGLCVAAATSPLWLGWLCWSWWRQLRAVEQDWRHEHRTLTGEYVIGRPRTHALPDDPA